MNIEKKLNVLSKIAKELNKNNITWAVGASLLLYFKGIVKEFNDIDIMVAEEGAEKVKEILLSFGKLQPKNPDVKYSTKVFMEFIVEGVDIDVIAGFTIINNGIANYFPLEREEIKETILLEENIIPLQSLEMWEKYYQLMGRDNKVRMIKKYFLGI